MRPTTTVFLWCLGLLLIAASHGAVVAADDPLPSRNDAPVKKGIVDFVGRVTMEGGPDFVPCRAHCHLRRRRHALGGTAVDFIDDKEGKPLGIQKFIGRRPIFAFGNSDGDHQTLQWTAAGAGPRFMGLVHHMDSDREWAYDRTSHIGKLDKALDEATAKGWTVVDMKRDWKKVFPFEKP